MPGSVSIRTREHLLPTAAIDSSGPSQFCDVCRSKVLMVRSGFQAVTLTTKATDPQKKKKVKGTEAEVLFSSDSHNQSPEINNTQRTILLSRKTVLLFPRRDFGPIPVLGETLASAQNILEGGERSMAVVHSAASRDSVTGKSVGAEEEAIPSSDSRSRSDSRSGSDSSSDSSSDSDEETVTEDAGKSAAELPKRLPIHSSPGRAAEQTRERKEVERGGLVREPDEVCQDVNVPESKDSTSTGVSTCEERKAQTGHRESTRQGNRMMASSEICAGDKATVTTPGARSLPITKPVTEESTASSSLKEWLLPAPGERPEPEHKWAKEGTPEAGVPDMAAMTQESMEKPVQESVEEGLDTSTYKNTQHHDYTPLTFVDLDMEMAKYRLPQPSSGRKSPRH